MRKLFVVLLLCAASFGQADSLTTACSLERLQEAWKMAETASQQITVHKMYSPHAAQADGTVRVSTDAERAAWEQKGKDGLAAIRKDYRGRTQALVRQALGMRASRGGNESAIYQHLQGSDYGWQEVSYLAKTMAAGQ